MGWGEHVEGVFHGCEKFFRPGYAANLVSTVKRGREKLHFINPVPLHEVYERWVRKFERQRLSLLHDLKKELEGE